MVSEIAVGLAVLMLFVWLSAVTLAVLRGKITRCPKCRSKRVRPSWPRIKDKFLPIFVRPRRCEACRKRFYTARSIDYTCRTRMPNDDLGA